MKTKKLILGLGISLLGCMGMKAQTGLQGIIVEKYYQTNAADAANALSNSAATTLNPGSVVYRVYVDMAPGYKFIQIFGNGNHPLLINTTTNFYNDPNSPAVIGAQGSSTTQVRQNTRMIDSYLTTGGVAAGRVGVLKTEDTDGSIGNANGVLANNPGGLFGAPINSVNPGAADGFAIGTPVVPTALGIGTAADIFDQTPGNAFSVTNGAVSALGGIAGTTTTNLVLIGQFTTDGVLGFKLNVQVQNTVTSVAETWVADNVQSGEFTLSALTLAPPTVTVTSPANNANILTGTTLTLAATAADNGTVTSVQFLVDGTPVGTDLTAPFTATYSAALGSHTITAIATDNDALTGNSAPVVISVANNQAPTVSVVAPSGAKVGDVLTFTASATDVDGTVTAVTFSVDNVAIGTVLTAPYTYTWVGTIGSHNVKASATDDAAAVGISTPVAFNVVNNLPPTVSVVTPTANASFITTVPSAVTIAVTVAAADADGTVTSVELLANGTPVATLTAGPFTFNYSPSAFGLLNLSARATDNNNTITTSAIVGVNVVNANQLPYEIGTVIQKCNQGQFCLPIAAASTYTVDNVIGYDVVLTYDAAKVTPTGSITVAPNLITPSLVTVVNAFANGTMQISASFIGSAPANTKFAGNGEIFCVGFTKNVMMDVDTAVFNILSVDESYYTGVSTKTATSGAYETYRDTLFNGKLRFVSNGGIMSYNVALPNDYLITNIYGSTNACVTNTVASPVQPDLNGDFVYNILNGNSINISRDILPTTPVQLAIQGNDAFIGRQILLNSTSLTPSFWQIVALDVNLDGIVSSGDISQINQRSVLNIPEFKQAWNYNNAGVKIGPDSKDYLFIDSTTALNGSAFMISATYPQNDLVGFSKFKVPSVPFCLAVPQTSLGTCATFTNETYRGILLGDADGNVAALSGSLQLRPSGDKVIVDYANAIINNNTIDIPVTFEASSTVFAYDLAMKFDEDNLSFVGVFNQSSVTDVLAYQHPEDRVLRLTSTNVDLSPFASKSPVTYLRFKMNSDHIDVSRFESLLGILNGNTAPVEVSSRAVGIINNTAETSINIFPNPTTGLLNVIVANDAHVQVLDITGRTIFFDKDVVGGKVETINVSELQNGVYIVKIQNDSLSTIRKVVLSK